MDKFKRFCKGDSIDYQFVKAPKDIFSGFLGGWLSNDAKVLYILMLQRLSLSVKNQWVDDEGKIYITYTRAKMMEDLHVAKGTVAKCIKELTGAGLIEQRKMGYNQANYIYFNRERIFQSSNIEPMDVQNLDPNKNNVIRLICPNSAEL